MPNKDLEGKKKFGEFLKTSLKKVHIDQGELARKLHVDIKTVWNWCDGRNFPNSATREKIENIIGINLTTMEPIITKQEPIFFDDKEEIRAIWRKIGELEGMVKLTMENHHQYFREEMKKKANVPSKP